MASEILSSFEIQAGVTITSNSRVYLVEEISNVDQNSAVFAQCRIQETGETVFLKCIQRKCQCRYKQEEKALNYLTSLNADENNLIKVIEIFYFHDWACFAFEKLERSLWDFFLERICKPLRIKEIRGIAQQMFLALNELKKAGITHTAVKAENIMLVNHELQPFKVKLTGFGTAGRTSTLSELEIPKTCGYSAPEVYLDCPLDESVDIWSLGCTLALLFLGTPLYPTNRDYEYNLESYNLKSLDDLLNMAPDVKDPSEYEDIKAFVDLLKKMLRVNPVDRISPADALKHRFINMEPLPGTSLNANVKETHEILAGSQVTNPDGVPEEEIQDLTDLTAKMEMPSLLLEKGLQIINQSNVYQVEEVLGSRSYEVARCRKKGTDEMVAIKLFRKGEHLEAVKEVNTYIYINKLDSNKNNLLRFIDNFLYKDCFCLVFELLDRSLIDFLKGQDWTPLRVAEIRPIAEQMLVALSALKSIGLTHTGIRPENIMLVNQKSQPFRVKLIDFGSACKTSTLSKYDVIRAIPCRSPEVHLGLPYDESIDMWGLGCTLAFLALGQHLFPIRNDYEALRVIVRLLGLPDKNSLDEGWKAKFFFTLDHSRSEVSWRLKTVDEYKMNEGTWVVETHPALDELESLDDLLKMLPKKAKRTEIADFKSFIDLLKKMLVVNPADRILPAEALKHRFITMEPLSGASLSSNETDSADEIKGTTLVLKKGLKIINKSNVYKIEEILGSGSYGEVAKCRKQGTNEMVAIKFFKKGEHVAGVREVSAYKKISKLDSNQNNLLRFIDSFLHKDCFSLIFELLDLNLFDLIKREISSPLRVAEIRPIAQQMLVALRALKSIGLTHTDIKPDNIVLVNQKSQPFKVKLIDFGLACESADLLNYQTLQAKAYRAPEVYLGLPRDEGIDMWGLGCTLAFLFLSNHLFPCCNGYEVVGKIVKLLGYPDQNSLDSGFYVKHFFTLRHRGPQHFWKLKTPEAYKRETGEKKWHKNPFYDHLGSLDDLVKLAPDKKNKTEIKDIKAFVHLLKMMLAVNPAARISPDIALQHRFITMTHLPDASNA